MPNEPTLVDPATELGELANGLLIVAQRRLGSRVAAEEAAQETLARALESIVRHGVRPEFPIAQLAYGILRHVVADMQRADKRFESLDTTMPLAAPSPLEIIVGAEERRGVAAALEQLSADDQALLRRCYVDGRRIVDIAEETGEPADRLRKRKSRALERLGTLLVQTAHRHETGPAADE
jgi:RNA polymerase sigma factor (sigma-70 family)